MALDKVVDSAALDAGMTSVADAIRAKAGTTGPLAWPDGFITAISGIETGVGDSAAGVIDKSVVNITSNVAEVGQYAFCECEMLETASFQMATKIHGGAFIGCKALLSVSAPNVTEIRSDAINYFMRDMDGGYMKDTLGAFMGCTSLATADFPVAVTIEVSAFRGCTNLTTADFPAAVTIEGSAFMGCTSLAMVDFPAAVTIEVSAFSGCTNLTTADFPAAVTIEVSAFAGCGELTYLKFPNAITIGKSNL